MSGAVDLRAALKDSLSLLQNDLDEAIVYLDDGATDSVVTSVGLTALLGMGAVNVHKLSSPSKQDASVGAMLCSLNATETSTTPDVVVFLMQLLHEAHDELVNLLEMHPMCRQMTVFCCYSADAHAQMGTQSEEQNAYAKCEADLQSKISQGDGSGTMKIDVRYCPWLYSCITSQAALLPCPATKASSLGFNAQASGHMQLYRDTSRQEEIQSLSHALVGFASHLGTKLDIYTLGPDSQAIGAEVVKMGVPVGFRESPHEKTASLVLVDRSFDLATPVHHADSLVDRIVAALNAEDECLFERSSRLMDLSVKLKSGISGTVSDVRLFAAEPPDLSALVAHLLGRTCRDGSLYVRKWIREEIREAGLRTEYKPKAGAPNKEEFMSGADLLQSPVSGSRRLSTRALAALTAKALDPDTGISIRAETVHSNERQILNTKTADDLVQYLLDLLQNLGRPEALLKFEDFCSLLTYTYSILNDRTTEPFNPTEEKLIVEAMVQCLMTEHNRASLEKLMSEPVQESVAMKSEVRLELQDRLEAVKQLCSMRSGLNELKRLSQPLEHEKHYPLIHILVSLILQNKNIDDLHHQTSTLQGIFEGASKKGFLSRGLGRLGFGRQQEVAVGGHDLVIVFVVGGISLHEVNSIAKEIEENGKGPWKPKIIVASSSLLTPKQTVKQLWSV